MMVPPPGRVIEVGVEVVVLKEVNDVVVVIVEILVVPTKQAAVICASLLRLVYEIGSVSSVMALYIHAELGAKLAVHMLFEALTNEPPEYPAATQSPVAHLAWMVLSHTQGPLFHEHSGDALVSPVLVMVTVDAGVQLAVILASFEGEPDW